MKKPIYFLIFFFGIALIIMGHRIIGPIGLLMMLAGLSFQIGLLWMYNQSYK